jgi:hypothetical protein
LSDRVCFSRFAQAHDVITLLHEARQQNLPSRRLRVAERHPLLAQASLRGSRLSGNSLSEILILADASLHGALLG